MKPLKNIASLLAVVIMLAEAAPALADCYKDIGCTASNRFRTSALRRLNCARLTSIRNTILFENGYCFRESGDIEVFGNVSCNVDDITKLPLNEAERTNVRTINKLKAEKGCDISP
jgi:hypothetical protein